MELPQSVYDVILSYWSAVKTIDERDHLHVNWFVMREMSCCCIVRRATFMKAWKALLPEWYENFNKKSELHYELREKCHIRKLCMQHERKLRERKLQASRNNVRPMSDPMSDPM